MQDEKILIDRNVLKAISSDTRFNILKLLNKRRYTLSELSEKLKLKKSTVTEHLKHLIDADLIIKKEDKRKWKYYYLSEKGKNLLQPKAITVYLAFIVSLFASFSLITYFLYNFFNNSIGKLSTGSKAIGSSSTILNNTTEGIKSAAVTTTSKTVNVTSTNFTSSITLINKILIILIIIFVITTIVFFIIYLKKRKNYVKVI